MAVFGVLVWLVAVWFWGCLCSFPPHHVVFPFPSMMTWALRPHGVRTRGKKKEAANWRQGTWDGDRELEAENCRDWRQGTWERELGQEMEAANWGRELGGRELEAAKWTGN